MGDIKVNQKGNKTIISGISGSGKTTKLLEILEEKFSNKDNKTIVFIDNSNDSYNKVIGIGEKLGFEVSKSDNLVSYSNSENKMIFLYINLFSNKEIDIKLIEKYFGEIPDLIFFDLDIVPERIKIPFVATENINTNINFSKNMSLTKKVGILIDEVSKEYQMGGFDGIYEDLCVDVVNKYLEKYGNSSDNKLFSELNYNFSKHNIDEQLVKIQEELGELIKAIKKGEGNIGEELADLLISTYGVANILGIDYEKEVENKIKIVNERIK